MSFAFKRDFDWNERAVPADLTIEIGAGRGVDRPETVADRLNELDAHMVRWQPAVRGEPARATFTFDSEAARAEFVARMAAYATVRVVS